MAGDANHAAVVQPGVRRPLATAIATAALVLAAACSHGVEPAATGADTPSTIAPGAMATTGGPLPTPHVVTAAEVLAKPWPTRVTPTAAWTASVDGVGNRVALMSVTGVVPGGLGQATLTLPSTDPRAKPAPTGNVDLTLPGGAKWYPTTPFHFDSTADLTFSTATTKDATVTFTVGRWAALLAQAPDPVTAVGTFVSADGHQVVDHLALPRATVIGRDCAQGSCPPATDVPTVTLAAKAGAVLKASTSNTASGEAAAAGSARAQALGKTWTGLVGAVEGTGLATTATWDGRNWSLAATARGAHQLWVDVWPVADTTLSATSAINGNAHNCLRNCDLRLRWLNTGFATSQLYEAEGLGPSGHTIGLSLNKSLGHDAGLGVGRGDREINLGGGGDVDSNQPPGGKVDRGLSYTPGTDVTLVLRGNFPDVSVHLAIPPA